MNTTFRLNPSHVALQAILQQGEVSDVLNMLGGGSPLVELTPANQQVYIPFIGMRGKATVNNNQVNQMPAISITSHEISAPVMTIQTEYIRQYRDEEKFDALGYNIPLVGLIEGACMQAHGLAFRDLCLYGNGLGGGLYTQAFKIGFPPDSLGATALSAMDSNHIFRTITTQIGALRAAALLTNTDLEGIKIRVLMPHRVMSLLATSVMKTTDFQVGATAWSVLEAITRTTNMAGGDVIIGVDNSLKGAGSGGTDGILIAIVERPMRAPGLLNTNAFGALPNGMQAINVQYADALAPIRYDYPLGSSMGMRHDWVVTAGLATSPEYSVALNVVY